MVDRRRYASHVGFGALAGAERPQGLVQLYRGGRAATSFKDLYETDHAETRQSGRFRWQISTCLAGMVGAISIFVVIYGSVDPKGSKGGFLPALSLMGEADLSGGMPFLHQSDGLKWAVPKSDRLQITSGAVTVRYFLKDSLKQRLAGREYIHAKPYVRIVGRLAAVPETYEAAIPPFNPLELYAINKTAGEGDETETPVTAQGSVKINVVELLGGILPTEDGLALDDAEIAQHIAAAEAAEAEAEKIRAGAEADANRAGADDATPGNAAAAVPPHTTVLTKPTPDSDDSLADLEGRETLVVKVGDNDNLRKILHSCRSRQLAGTRHDRRRPQHLPGNGPSRRPGGAHYARALTDPEGPQGAGALQHLLGRA